MKWAYDLTGAEPIIQDVTAFDATTIVYGELLMMSAAVWSAGSDAGVALISAYSTTVNTAHAVKAVGISLETKTTADSPSIATAANTTAEACFVKTIINPLAIYRAECTTAEEIAITSWTTTHLVVPDYLIDSSDGCWVYFSATAGPNFGELRLNVLTDATASLDLVTNVVATATTADKVTCIMPKFRQSNPLNIGATGVAAISSGTTGIGGTTTLRVVESWIDRDRGFERLENHIHDGITAKKAGPASSQHAKFYNDLQMIDNFFVDAV